MTVSEAAQNVEATRAAKMASDQAAAQADANVTAKFKAWQDTVAAGQQAAARANADYWAAVGEKQTAYATSGAAENSYSQAELDLQAAVNGLRQDGRVEQNPNKL